VRSCRDVPRAHDRRCGAATRGAPIRAGPAAAGRFRCAVASARHNVLGRENRMTDAILIYGKST
jgi:hypothetical protein